MSQSVKMSAWIVRVIATEATKADSASEDTRLMPRPPSLTGRLAWHVDVPSCRLRDSLWSNCDSCQAHIDVVVESQAVHATGRVFVIQGRRKLRRLGVVSVTQQSLHHGYVRICVGRRRCQSTVERNVHLREQTV